jgi:selenocysteine-specific elongation factor
VDHGKTALVKALTGIDTDRLPEEKARGMTTDLGFAAFRLFAPALDRSFGPPLDIGVIDVPGHERYIRNMVAGAWSLDLALLVVAADDGWMEQSENHARVLHASGISRVILTITKIDKVRPDHIVAVKADALRRGKAMFGDQASLSIVGVSALSNEGIDALKALIALEAMRIEAGRGSAAGTYNGFLFVDRVFSKRGTGRIACGTLVGGKLAVDDEIVQSPGNELLRIRGIESLGKAIPCSTGSSRVALNVSKAKSELRRGDLLFTAPDTKVAGERNFFYSGREFLIKVEPLTHSDSAVNTEAEVLKKGGEIEVAVGTAWRLGRIIPLGKMPWYRFSCEEELAFPISSPLVLIRHGGAEILGRAWVLFQGKTDRIQRRKLADTLKGLETKSQSEIAVIIQSALFPKPKNETERKPPNSIPIQALNSHNAFNLEPTLLKAEQLLRSTSRKCLEYPNGTVISTGSPIAQPNLQPALPLPPRKDMDRLCALGIAIPLDRNLFIHREAYMQLVSQTLKTKKPRDTLEISEAKERTGFSRKFVIPFLNRMERDGYIKRDGERRIILSLP